jgi:hypothetical protein
MAHQHRLDVVVLLAWVFPGLPANRRRVQLLLIPEHDRPTLDSHLLMSTY